MDESSKYTGLFVKRVYPLYHKTRITLDKGQLSESQVTIISFKKAAYSLKNH